MADPVTEATELTYTEVIDLIYDNLGQDAFYKARTSVGQEFFTLCNQAGVDVSVSPNGDILGYYKHTVGSKPLSSASEIAEQLNSNLQSGTAAIGNTGAFTEVVDTAVEGGQVITKPTVTKFTDGMKGVLNTPVAGKITPALMAASAGIQLGKVIDGSIYHIGKAMGLNPPEDLDPSTWGSITEDMSDEGLEGLDKWAFNTILGINKDTGKTEMYVDENAFAYFAQYLNKAGFFEQGETILVDTPIQNVKDHITLPIKFGSSPLISNDRYYDSLIPFALFKKSENDNGAVAIAVSTEKLDNVVASSNIPTLTVHYIGTDKVYTYDNKTAYASKLSFGGASTFPANISNMSVSSTLSDQVAWSMLYGTIKTSSKIDGVTNQNNATFPDLSGATTTQDALNILKTTYPDLWNNRIEQNVLQSDGTSKLYNYIPLPVPTSGEGANIDTQGAVQNEPTVDNKNGTESQISTLIKIITQNLPQGQTQTLPKDYPINPTDNPNPPDKGGGDTPITVPVTGSASSLYAIYNPTLGELNSFGAWLWSSDFIDQLKKLFNDPMQAIIGLHKIYATPVTGAAQNIKVGYLDSGVSSAVVTNQYTTIDCGTVSLREYFGSVFDYSPYTQVQLYLPFIGIVNLDVADVMRASINIVYHVDVLTGACLAEVRVTRDSAGGTLYQYAGNAAVTLPISSGSYMGIVASIASIAGGVAGTLASGGAAAPMLIGAAGSALTARTRVEHSGGFSGNAGAMGGKIPYLIISRPQTEMADNYSIYIGNPANKTVSLGSCSGYVQVKECHLENIPATQNELNQIESLLKGGVLL